MIEANEFKQTVNAEVTAPLVSLGFEAFRRHKWVLSVTAPIRRVFALYNLKSLSLVPVWEFSFDFVPHLGAGDEVKWHRTARSDLAPTSRHISPDQLCVRAAWVGTPNQA